MAREVAIGLAMAMGNMAGSLYWLVCGHVRVARVRVLMASSGRRMLG